MSTTPVLTRTSFIWTLYLLLGLFGFSLTMIGPMVPYLQAETGMSYSLAGFHQSVVALGMVVMGFTAGPLLRRLGIQLSLWGGLAGIVLGVAVLSLGRGLAYSLGGVLLMSLSGTLMLAAIQTCFALEAVELRGRMIMEANVLASIATMLVPLLLLFGAWLGLGWRVILPALFLSLLVMLSFGPRATGRRLKARASLAREARGRLPARYWRMWLIIFFGVTVEWAVSFWCMTYLLGLPGGSMPLAAAGTFTLGLSAVIGRLVSSRLSGRLSDRHLLYLVLGMIAAGFPLYWLRASAFSAFLGLALCGFGASTFYPLGLALSMAAAPKNPTTASSLAPVASGLAIGLAPFLLGRVADGSSMELALLYIPLGLAAILVLVLLDRREGRQPQLAKPARG